MHERTADPSLRQSAYLALGHFVTDLYPAFLPPLLPLLIDKFQISFTRASVLAMVLTLSASLTQPFFGFLFDKVAARKILVFGPLVGGLGLSLIGLAPHYSFLVILLVLGGLGIASFHPEAAALAYSLSGPRRTLGISIFMLGGNLGYSLGPFLILAIVMGLGLEWSLVACLPVLGLAWLLHKRALLPEKLPRRAFAPGDTGPFSSNRRFFHLGVLLSVVVLRVTAALSLITFLPTIQKLRGFSLVAAGSSFTVFMAFGAIGSLSGGFLGDRVGRKRIILTSFVLLFPALVAFLSWRGPMSFFVLAPLGFFFFLGEPACIVLAQEMVPGKARTTSGLTMGMAWGLAGLGVLATGALADAMGIEKALRFVLILPATALLLSFFLPSGIKTGEPVTAMQGD